MMSSRSSRSAFAALGLAAVAAFGSSCSDPLRDQAVDRLGGETDIPVGPLHRPGQPCLACHSKGGPASNSPFAVAGTVFSGPNRDARPVAGVQVILRDANNNSPGAFQTNESGNFFVRTSEWNLAYPFRVALQLGQTQATMISVVNREGSCNYCHRPGPDSPFGLASDEPSRSTQQVFIGGATP